jgi:hypothetical protein
MNSKFIEVPDFGATHSWRIPAKLQAKVWSLTTCKTRTQVLDYLKENIQNNVNAKTYA